MSLLQMYRFKLDEQRSDKRVVILQSECYAAVYIDFIYFNPALSFVLVHNCGFTVRKKGKGSPYSIAELGFRCLAVSLQVR